MSSVSGKRTDTMFVITETPNNDLGFDTRRRTNAKVSSRKGARKAVVEVTACDLQLHHPVSVHYDALPASHQSVSHP